MTIMLVTDDQVHPRKKKFPSGRHDISSYAHVKKRNE
jgi:hypothetical protein